MRGVRSDDSVRRAMGRLEEGQAEQWLRSHLDRVVRPLLEAEWILDIETTVKPVYGQQDGAVIGCNATQRGRLSQAIHL